MNVTFDTCAVIKADSAGSLFLYHSICILQTIVVTHEELPLIIIQIGFMRIENPAIRLHDLYHGFIFVTAGARNEDLIHNSLIIRFIIFDPLEHDTETIVISNVPHTEIIFCEFTTEVFFIDFKL